MTMLETKESRALLGLLVILGCLCCVVIGQQDFKGEWSGTWDYDYSWRDKPWTDYDDEVVVRTYYGDVRGFSIPWHIEDLWFDRRYHERPPWYVRRINCFLGVPYAEAPVGKRRFKRTRPPRWGGTWEAKWYRPACPQKLEYIREEIPSYPKTNVSEDCLYMNIYAPNITDYQRREYPVIVWIHGGDFSTGSAQLTPGHILATRDVILVTFNYRLGAFGWLTTEDQYSSGNYGLFDQHQALSFVKENIRAFKGDPNQITLAGEGAGGTSVGMHLLSPRSRGKKFFHQTIMMSGTDLSQRGFVSPYWRPRDYAIDLGRRLGCPIEDTYLMLICMRDEEKITWEKILDAQAFVQPKNGVLGIVWGPTQDGGWFNVAGRTEYQPFLPQTPIDIRNTGDYDSFPCLIGLNTQDGAKLAVQQFGSQTLEAGLFRSSLRKYIDSLLNDLNVADYNKERAAEAVEFQYTWWAEPDNRTAQTQEFFNLLTDLNYGVAMDEVLKLNSRQQPTYMYQFNYKSWSDWLPKWMGVSYSAAVPYVFGFPFMNETVLNQTDLIPRQHYDYEDRNMSDWMMYMWTNFAKYGEPTPNITYNVTWEPFSFNNLSFLQIEEHSHIWFRYRQSKYGFWREFFPTIAEQVPYFPTPTPAGYEYVIATGSMSALLIILLCGLCMLIYMLWWHSHQQKLRDEYRSGDVPLSFMTRSTKQAVGQGGEEDWSAAPGTSRGYGSGPSASTSRGYTGPGFGAGLSTSQSQYSVGSGYSGSARSGKSHNTSHSTQHSVC